MKRQLWGTVVMVGGLVLALSVPALAQEAVGDFTGTITLRGGETLSGTIKLAEFGVVLGSGVGTLREEYGSLRLKTAEGEVVIPGRDIWTIEADWNNDGADEQPNWVITQIVVTKKDGSKLTGQPTWLLHCSTASVALESGETKRMHAFPLAQKDFSPDNFIKTVVIGKEPPPAEAPAEKPAEPPAEKPAEAPAEKPAEAPAEKPAEPPAEKPAEAPAEKPAEPPAEKPAEAPAEKPSEPPAEKPAEAPAEKPAEPPAEKPAETPAEKPAEKPAEAPAEKPAEAPAEKPAEAPAEKPAEAPAEKPAEAPAEKPTEPPAEKPAEPPAEKPAEAPAEKPAEPAIPPTPVKCVLVFMNLTDEAEVERVKGIVAVHASEGEVEVATGEAGEVTMTSTLPDATVLAKLAEDIKFKAAADGAKTLVFEETGRQVTSTFRTATISGSVKVTVTFSITPGAKLFHSPAAGEETEVPAEKVAEDGSVALEVAIARGQEFVYARTVLGEVEKCINIDIFTGAVTQITKADYEAHK